MKHHIITISKLMFHKIHSFKRSFTMILDLRKGTQNVEVENMDIIITKILIAIEPLRL